MGGDTPDFGGDSESNDKPFDDEPFDAGVEADEDSDPKKFIEQLTGKLGQSLRKYTEEQGQPDFELEKFAINSLLSATHTAEMDSEDKEDIIKKVNTSGSDGEDNEDTSSDNQDDSSDDFGDSDEPIDDFSDDMGGDENSDEEDLQEFSVYESKMDSLFLDKPKKNDMFQEGSNDILDEDGGCWSGYKRKAGTEKFAKGSCEKIEENLIKSKNISIFGKDNILSKLRETFNQDEPMNEPMVEPEVKPDVKPAPVKEPSIAPSRKNKPFLPMPEVTPDPKAIKEGVWSDIMKGVNKGSLTGPWAIVAIQNNKVIGQDIDVKYRDAIPAHYEEMKRNYPNAMISIEDNEGRSVWNSKF